MSLSEHPEVLGEMDRAREHCDSPSVDTVLQEHCSDGHTSPRNLTEPHVPDEGAFYTYVGGAGI
jgi:hypothetical protein